ncbi:MAG: MbnP family copper-binding protein, partial [Gemmobacter sp.]
RKSMRCFTFAALAATLAAPVLADQPVTITFAAEIAGTPFTCGTPYAGIGTTGSTVEVADFRLFVSNARMVAADGSETPILLDQDGTWQVETVALLDFEDATGTCINGTPEINTTLRGTVPEGAYTGLAFDIGVPFDLNHGDPTLAASPLNLTAMFWNWQGGYKFIKLDMATSGQALEAAQTSGDHAGSAAQTPRARLVAASGLDRLREREPHDRAHGRVRQPQPRDGAPRRVRSGRAGGGDRPRPGACRGGCGRQHARDLARLHVVSQR